MRTANMNPQATKPTTSTQEPLGRNLVWVMAITSGAAAANLYYNQPLLAIIAQDLHASPHEVGLIPMCTQMGYAVGIFLLVPLGDLRERRRLILTMLAMTAVALAIAAFSNFADVNHFLLFRRQIK
jgi:predicted MFS family arabinose efflux permease